MKKGIIIILIFFSFNIYAQEWSYGFSWGNERIMSLPHIGYKYFYKEKKNLKLSIGSDIGVWFMFVLWHSASIKHEVELNSFSFDSSIGILNIPRKSVQGGIIPYRHLTLNPKFGYNFKKVSFKVGPSFILWSSYTPRPLPDIKKGLNINIEVNFKFRDQNWWRYRKK